VTVIRKVSGPIPPGGTYIGRNRCHGDTFWGNWERHPAPYRYEAWLKTADHILARIDELRGQNLYCHCYPRVDRCHGGVLAEVAVMTNDERERWRMSTLSCMDHDFGAVLHDPDVIIVEGDL